MFPETMFEGVSKEQITIINDVIDIMKNNIKKCKGEQMFPDLYYPLTLINDYKYLHLKHHLLHYQILLLEFLQKRYYQNALAKKLNITKATLSVRLQRLEKLGYLTKTQDKNDKRNYILNITKISSSTSFAFTNL